MPVATPEIYSEMLDKAKREPFAYPAINAHTPAAAGAHCPGTR
jgi:fructose-bisphosphate aldolase class II